MKCLLHPSCCVMYSMSLLCLLPVSSSVRASSLICSAAVLLAERGESLRQRKEEEKWKWKTNKEGILWNSGASQETKLKRNEEEDVGSARKWEKKMKEYKQEYAELALLHYKLWVLQLLLYNKSNYFTRRQLSTPSVPASSPITATFDLIKHLQKRLSDVASINVHWKANKV